MKTRSPGRPSAALIATSLMIITSSCGLGTEIGNGLRPGSSTAGTGTDEPAAKQEPYTASNSVPSDDAASGSSSSHASTSGDVANILSQLVDLKILYTSCASPFADAFQPASGVTLKFSSNVSGVETVDAFSAEYSSASGSETAHWTIVNADAATVAIVSEDSAEKAHHALVLDPNSSPMSDAYLCASVTDVDLPADAKNNLANAHQTTAIMTDQSKAPAATVVWTVSPDRTTLLHIDITSATPGAAVISLDAK